MSARPPKPITLQNTFDRLKDHRSDDEMPPAKVLGEVGALDCQAGMERQCRTVAAAATPVPTDEFDLEDAPTDRAVAWACQQEPTRGEELLAKLTDEQAATIRAATAHVPWLGKPSTRWTRPAGPGANPGASAHSGQQSLSIASCQAGDVDKNNPGQGFRGHPWGVSTSPRV